MMVVLLRIRDAYLRRFPKARHGWTVGDLERLSSLVLAVPAYLLMRTEYAQCASGLGTPSSGATLSERIAPVWAAHHYPATEHLGKLAALRKNWSARQRQAWIRTQRCQLWAGHVAKIVEAIQVFCRGRNSKVMMAERDYFVRNRQRMAYQTVRALKLPISSGAIESALRRVVNLPLKGACVFWGEDNAEKILTPRAFKAGRWSLLKQTANSHLSLVTA